MGIAVKTGIAQDVTTKHKQGDQELIFERRELPLTAMPMPPAGQVDLWFLDLGELGSPMHDPAAGAAPVALNSRQERTVRRFYLRLLLASYLGITGKDVRISRLVRGKPVLDYQYHKQQLDFSSASSRGCCLIGISSGSALGVDLEESGRQTFKPLALARRYFSDKEQQALWSLDASEVDQAFLHTWACKEAVVKAAGLGIANQLSRFTVDTNPANPPAVLEMRGDAASDWRLAMVQPAAGFVGSVAFKSPQLRLKGYVLGHRPNAP